MEAVLAAGSEKAAAHRLGLSHSTVKHHLANARSKVGATTTAQLVWILAPRLPDADGEAQKGNVRSRRPVDSVRVDGEDALLQGARTGAPPGGSMNEIDERVNRHYGWSGLMETIEEEIRRKGIDPTRVTVDELAPVDNYHWHRLAGTLALGARGGDHRR